MRFVYCCITLLIVSHLACAQGMVKLSGRIQNPVSDSVMISYNENRIAYYPQKYFARLDKKGNFSMSFPVPGGMYIQADLVHGNKVSEMVLQPGDKLTMTVNAARFDSTLHFEGKGSEIANFIVAHKIARGRLNQYTVKVRTAINKEPAEFLSDIANEKQAEVDYLNKHKEGLPLSFMNFWTASYEYYNYFFMQQYPQTHEMVKRRKYTDTVPELNYSVLKAMPDAFYDTLLPVTPYLLYLTGVLEIRLRAAGMGFPANDAVKAQELNDSVTSLAYRQLPDKSAEYVVAQNIYGRARHQEPERNEQQLNAFKKRWPHSPYMAVLDKQVGTAKRLSKGQPAPDLNITTIDGRKMKLSDLKGKVVYLHFWATWCKQCVGEIMGEHKIKDLIKNKPLEFVYISIDRDTTAVRSVIEKLKLEGIFANVTGEWDAKALQAYGVQNLPADYLIDEDGNIAVQNAAAPSQSTQLILDIEKLFR